MENLSIFQLVAAALVGGVITQFFTLWAKRRAKFVYTVRHAKIGTSADDPTFGSIKVLYNELPAKNLWLSTLELTNTSLRDVNNVPIVVTAAAPATLLNETFQINGVFPNKVPYEEDYLKSLMPKEGEQNDQDQRTKIYSSQRCYRVAVVNRSDKLVFTYLTHTPENMPELRASISALGTRCVYRPLRNLPLDLPQTILKSLGFGFLVAIPTLFVLTYYILDPVLAMTIGWGLGLLTGTIGLLIAWVFGKLRDWLFN